MGINGLFFTHKNIPKEQNSVIFDYTEIDRMLGIEICLNNDAKSVVRF